MLVDINLLPEKIRERSTLLWIAVAILVASLLCWAVLFWLTGRQAEQAESLRQQAFEVQKQQEQITSELRLSAFGQEKEQLAATVKLVEEYQYKTLPLIEELVHLLPDRGFFMTFTFTAPNEATFDVQFDDQTDVIHYLTRMKASPLITGATVQTVEAEALDEEELARNVLPRYIATYFIQFLDERALAGTDAAVDSDEISDPEEVTPSAEEPAETGTPSGEGGETNE